MTNTNIIKQVKNLLLQLTEYKTNKDVEGIEAIITDNEERQELFDYLFRLQNDCICAKNTTINDIHEYYKKRESILLELIGCITLIDEKQKTF